jgi:hypothetical protein
MIDNLAAGRIRKACRVGRAGLHSAYMQSKAARKRKKGYTPKHVTL